MTYMHCWIRVVDFSKWKTEMEADAEAHFWFRPKRDIIRIVEG
jgi:hypothetical protein